MHRIRSFGLATQAATLVVFTALLAACSSNCCQYDTEARPFRAPGGRVDLPFRGFSLTNEDSVNQKDINKGDFYTYDDFGASSGQHGAYAVVSSPLKYVSAPIATATLWLADSAHPPLNVKSLKLDMLVDLDTTHNMSPALSEGTHMLRQVFVRFMARTVMPGPQPVVRYTIKYRFEYYRSDDPVGYGIEDSANLVTETSDRTVTYP